MKFERYAQGTLLVASFLLLTAAGRAQASAASSSGQTDAARPPAAATPAAKAPAYIQVPAGTKIPLVLENAISTRSARAGDPLYFRTLYPILVGGHIVIPAGSYMSGSVVSSQRPIRIKGKIALVLKLSQLILPNGYMVNLAGSPSDVGTGGPETMGKEGQIKGPGSKARDAEVILGTTTAGTAIGGEVARTATGAVTGLGVGAAASLLAVLLSHGRDVNLPRGTTMDIRLDHPLELLASRAQFKTPGQAPELDGPR